MYITRLLIVLALLVGLATFGIAQANPAMAQAPTPANPMSSIVDRLSTKFNLDKTQVESVFKEEHTARFANRLTQRVAEGKLTEAKKQLILQKHLELLAWSQQNDIDLHLLMHGHGGKMGKFAR